MFVLFLALWMSFVQLLQACLRDAADVTLWRSPLLLHTAGNLNSGGAGGCFSSPEPQSALPSVSLIQSPRPIFYLPRKYI